LPDESKAIFKTRAWVTISLVAAVICAASNAFLIEVSTLGMISFAYMGPGILLASVCYYITESTSNYIKGKSSSVDFNIRKNNSIEWWNILGMIGIGAIYTTISFLVLIIFMLCRKSGMNAGIVTTIWSTSPLFGAMLDYLIFGQKLNSSHIAGVFCVVLCAIFISISNVLSTTRTDGTIEDTSKWVPIVMALFTPFAFAS
jgi:drug/metabolite transporter (DMT)-like permease